MENKINIAELLKDCPKGMELDCTMYNEVCLFNVDDNENITFPIRVVREDGNSITLTKYGQCTDADFAKCVIFPKGKTTWEGFIPPCKFKDGDIVAFDNTCRTCLEIFIFKDKKENNTLSTCYLMFDGNELYLEEDMYYVTRLATEEEKEKLFQAIKERGYKWNAETKTLEKLIVQKFKVGDKVKDKNNRVWFIVQVSEKHFDISSVPNAEGYFVSIEDQDDYELINGPKFKVGDKVRHRGNYNVVFTISSIKEDYYACGIAKAFWFADQDDYELVPNKFDISTLIPFESRVLVRDNNREKWKSNFWGFYDSDHSMNHPHECCGNTYRQCIPYEGNEHLLGKTDDCDEFYKTW